MIEPLRLSDEGLVLLDQRRLPAEEAYLTLRNAEEVADAIREMVVRGAPAIGVSAAFGFALGARNAADQPAEAFRDRLGEVASVLEAARPTAVNLAWAVRRMLGVATRALDEEVAPAEVARRLLEEAKAMRDEDVETNRAMGRAGSLFIPDGARVLTHCNAGALATAGYGTALGVIRAAVEEGKKVSVLADETRPYLQGARLTAWELEREGIPVSLITDSSAGALMARGAVDVVVVGADRIARNGDVANKIGTYTVAVLARRHGIPFYVAAPLSTIDAACPDGASIPIEERGGQEVTHLAGQRVAPEGVAALNPAFDVTPAELVTAIVTEAGVARPPYGRSLASLLGIEEETPKESFDAAELGGAADEAEDADALEGESTADFGPQEEATEREDEEREEDGERGG